MRRIFCILSAVCILPFSVGAAQETRPPLRLGDRVSNTDYWINNGIPTSCSNCGWSDYITAAQSGDAPDLAMVQTECDDFAACKNAGLLADLSGSAAIRAWTDRLRPEIKRLVTTEDGKIVGLAEFAIYLPMYWRQDAWDAARLTREDVPRSYTELLDFLEQWMERSAETPRKNVCVANPVGSGKSIYVYWLLNLPINTWEMQQYNAGEALNFNTPEFVMLLERTRDIGMRLNLAEPGEAKRKRIPQLFENYNGGDRYNAGREYGISHSVPFRITAEQPGLMRAIATISVVRADSQWLPEAIGCMEYRLKDRPDKGYGNADLLADVQPRTHDPRIAYSPATVTAGYLADIGAYSGIVCFAPMHTIDVYERALGDFVDGELSAEQLAAQISVPAKDPD